MAIPLTRAAVGAPITAGMYNQLVDSFSAPIVRLTTNVSQNTGTAGLPGADVKWNQETYDDYGMHDNVSNNTRITIPAGWGGYYYVRANIRTQVNANTTTAQFKINGTVQTDSAFVNVGSATLSPFCPISDFYLLSAGDYLEVNVFNTAANQSILGGNCSFGAYFIHP